MGKLCVIYNSAAHYRGPVFLKMDEDFDIEWHFGTFASDSIKQMDISQLKNAKRHPTKYFKSWCWMPGYVSLLFNKDYDTFLALGETHNISTIVFLILHKIFCKKKKVYFWTHGFYGKETKVQMAMKKWMFKMVDGNFTYGQHSKDIMVKEGFNPDKIWPIHNSLNHAAQVKLRNLQKPSDVYSKHFGNDNPNLIFIGRLTPVKRLDQLIDCLSELHKRGCKCNLTFIGGGEEMNSLQQKAKSMGLEKSIWFYGACYDDVINAELVYNADLCVAPGNVGLTAMHCMVFGCPVVTHDNFAYQMPEYEAIKEGKTGKFFRYMDIASMTNTVEEWISQNKDRREEVRQSCYDEIDNYWTPEYQVKVLKKRL